MIHWLWYSSLLGLVQLLQDPDPLVRAKAAEAMGRFHWTRQPSRPAGGRQKSKTQPILELPLNEFNDQRLCTPRLYRPQAQANASFHSSLLELYVKSSNSSFLIFKKRCVSCLYSSAVVGPVSVWWLYVGSWTVTDAVFRGLNLLCIAHVNLLNPLIFFLSLPRCIKCLWILLSSLLRLLYLLLFSPSPSLPLTPSPPSLPCSLRFINPSPFLTLFATPRPKYTKRKWKGVDSTRGWTCVWLLWRSSCRQYTVALRMHRALLSDAGQKMLTKVAFPW